MVIHLFAISNAAFFDDYYCFTIYIECLFHRVFLASTRVAFDQLKIAVSSYELIPLHPVSPPATLTLSVTAPSLQFSHAAASVQRLEYPLVEVHLSAILLATQ